VNYALVTETFPPEINGVARTLERLVRGLVERGHTASVIRPSQGRNEIKEPKSYTEIIVRGAPIPMYSGLRFGLPAYSKLKYLWTQSRPDAIHVATEGPLGVTAILVARRLGIPVYSSFHTNFHSYGVHYGLSLLMRPTFAYLRWVHNRTLATFAPSDDVCASLRKAGFDNVYRMERGVDTVLFSPDKRDAELRQSWGAGESDPVVVYVGRIAGEKNIPLLINTFMAMREREPRMKLVLVGDGPERERLKREHSEFIFVGSKVGEELARYYASGDLFLFPSLTETFGNVVTEAMGSGLLVLAYDYAAAQRFICNGVNGYTVPTKHIGAFIRSGLDMLENREKWVQMRSAARETAMSLSWDTVIDGYLKIMESKRPLSKSSSQNSVIRSQNNE